MKKAVILFIALLLLFLPCAFAEDSLKAAVDEVKSAATLNEQLAMLNQIGGSFASVLEAGGWDVDMRIPLHEPLPEKLMNPHYTQHEYDAAIEDSLPDGFRNMRLIVLCAYDQSEPDALAGDIMVRLPAANRAASAEEADAVMVMRSYTEARSDYIGAAYDNCCDSCLWRVGSEEMYIVKRWRTIPPLSGRGMLVGEDITAQSLWSGVRGLFYDEVMRVTDENGSLLHFRALGETTCELTSVELAEGVTELAVPQTAEGYQVTRIGYKCMENNRDIRAVSLPEGITTIGVYAFRDCVSLIRADLPETLENINSSAFYGCRSLRTLDLPDSVKRIETSALNLPSLEAVRIPASIEVLEDTSICGDKIARIVVSEGVTRIRNWPYIKNLACCYLPSSLEYIGGLMDNYRNTVFYAPENSYALKWMRENGYECMACESEADMPSTEYITESDFEFLVFNGEAALYDYLGNDASVILPAEAAGVPVTALLYNSLFHDLENAVIPGSVTDVGECDVSWSDRSYVHNLYIANPDASISKLNNLVTIHAPEGSMAQQFAEEHGNPFEPWDGVAVPF